jgi:hypothetical protein
VQLGKPSHSFGKALQIGSETPVDMRVMLQRRNLLWGKGEVKGFGLEAYTRRLILENHMSPEAAKEVL